MNRGAIWLAGAAVLLPATLASTMAEGAVDAVATNFQPPSAPLTLTRTLYRPLADGNQVVVTRRYKVQFTPDGEGYRLDGELIDAAVDAPAELAPIAEIERTRQERGMFPILIGSDGMIRHEPAVIVDVDSRRRVVESASEFIAKAPITPAAKIESAQYLAQIVKSSTGSRWPRFLFNPGESERHESRQVPMPDGSVGQIDVRVRADGLMPGGMARRVERIVTTSLGGTVRIIREVWTLTL